MLAALLFVAWFSWWGRQPFIHREVARADLLEFVDVLVDRGTIGARMLVRPVEVPPIPLQVIKYGSPESWGLRFALPLVSTHELALASAVRGGGFPAVDVPPNSEESRPFLVVNLGQDRRELVRLIEHASDALGAHDSVAELWFEDVPAGPWRRSS